MGRGAKEKRERRWIQLIPIYHLLCNVSDHTNGPNHRTPKWWGTEGFNDHVQKLKESTTR